MYICMYISLYIYIYMLFSFALSFWFVSFIYLFGGTLRRVETFVATPWSVNKRCKQAFSFHILFALRRYTLCASWCSNIVRKAFEARSKLSSATKLPV